MLGFIFTKGAFYPGPDLWISLFIGLSYLLYGYSFNRLCDTTPKDWLPGELFFVFSPIFAGLFLTALRFPPLILPLGIAVFLNTLYSLPSILWKRNTFVSSMINAYLFGCLFLVGAYAGYGSYTPSIIVMSFYMASFFIPGQLWHELAHAQEDKRFLSISRNRKKYLAGILVSIGFLCIFSLVLKIRLSLGWVFVSSHLLWAVFLWCFYTSGIWTDFSVDKARRLRKCFKIIGMMFGICYLFEFLTR